MNSDMPGKFKRKFTYNFSRLKLHVKRRSTPDECCAVGARYSKVAVSYAW